MAGINTDKIDISKYKCVPLDLLKNVNDKNQVQFQAAGSSIPLTDFKKEVETQQTVSAPKKDAISMKAMEDFFVSIVVIAVLLVLGVMFFNLVLNFRKYGLAAFSLPEAVRGLPVIAICSAIFFIIGFLFGILARGG
jgi:hypothetical protein